MKIRFEHDMSHNYVIPEPEMGEKTDSREDETDYEVHMLEENQIHGFMKCIRKRINGITEYYYEITSRQPLSQICEGESLRNCDIRKILSSLYHALQQMDEYLLDGNKLVLDPALIYLDVESREAVFCYLPVYKKSIQDGFRALASYLLYHLNQSDTEAVLLVYEINRKVQEKNYALLEILQDNQEKSEEREKNVHQTSGTDAKIPEDRIPAKEAARTQESGIKREDEQRQQIKGRKAGKEWKKTKKSKKEERKEQRKEKKQGKRTQMLTGIVYLVVMGITGIAAWMQLLTVTQAGGITFLITAALAYALSSEKSKKENQGQKSKKETDIKWKLPENIEEAIPQEPQEIKTVKINNQKDRVSEAEEEVGATTLLWKGEAEYEPHLTLISMNPRERNSVVLLKDSYVIGKLKSKADICLENEGISRIHAKIQKEGEEYYLYDMNSTNGTFLNGRRLGVNEKVPLHVSDEVAFAKLEYYVGNC